MFNDNKRTSRTWSSKRNKRFKPGTPQLLPNLRKIYEKGLKELLEKNNGTRLAFTTDAQRAMHESNVFIMAVGTPSAEDCRKVSSNKMAPEMCSPRSGALSNMWR